MFDRRLPVVGVGVLYAAILSSDVPAKDWPQWGGQDGRNMVCEERGLAESFVPGEKSPQQRVGPTKADLTPEITT